MATIVIVFGDDYELVGYQVRLLNPDCDHAPRGTLISWTAYRARQWADQLPPDAPAIPHDSSYRSPTPETDRPTVRVCDGPSM